MVGLKIAEERKNACGTSQIQHRHEGTIENAFRPMSGIHSRELPRFSSRYGIHPNPRPRSRRPELAKIPIPRGHAAIFAGLARRRRNAERTKNSRTAPRSRQESQTPAKSRGGSKNDPRVGGRKPNSFGYAAGDGRGGRGFGPSRAALRLPDRDRHQGHRVVAKNVHDLHGDGLATGRSVGVAGGDKFEGAVFAGGEACHSFSKM